jgi:hypothetical protein
LQDLLTEVAEYDQTGARPLLRRAHSLREIRV